jgi:DNA polymerase
MTQLSLIRVVGDTIKTQVKCGACELCESPELATERMSGFGNENPTYMIIGIAPGQEDDRIGRPMTGANGRLLKKLLSAANIQEYECFFTNTLRCCPHGKTFKERQFSACREYLIQEINEKKPTVIISAGAKALNWLTGQRGVSKLTRRGLPCILSINR